MFQTKFSEKLVTRFILISPTPTPRKSWRLWDYVEKFTNAEEHEQFSLSTKNYKHMLSECVILIVFPLQQLYEPAFEEPVGLSWERQQNTCSFGMTYMRSAVW
jgi:hypothetical protein